MGIAERAIRERATGDGRRATGDAGAVILAAGAGTRMGGVAKAMLRRGGRTFLECIAAHGFADAVVVVGPPHDEAVAAHARELGLRVARNARPEMGMASSIGIGFAAIAEGTTRAAWLWPVDHPDVSGDTLTGLFDALGEHAVARPVFGSRGGHPPLIARRLWARLVGCTNARDVIAEADRIDVPVDDPGCVRDVDVPEDL